MTTKKELENRIQILIYKINVAITQINDHSNSGHFTITIKNDILSPIDFGYVVNEALEYFRHLYVQYPTDPLYNIKYESRNENEIIVSCRWGVYRYIK